MREVKDLMLIGGMTLIALLLVVLNLLIFPADIMALLKFIYKFVGPTALLLIPMMIFTISILIMLFFGEELTPNVLYLINICQFLAPLLGILGTLIGFMGGTVSFTKGFNMKTVGNLIVNTGQGIGSTLLGIILFGILSLITMENQNSNDNEGE